MNKYRWSVFCACGNIVLCFLKNNRKPISAVCSKCTEKNAKPYFYYPSKSVMKRLNIQNKVVTK